MNHINDILIKTAVTSVLSCRGLLLWPGLLPFVMRMSTKRQTLHKPVLLATHSQDPLFGGLFFSRALNTLSIYNKSSEALLPEPRHAPRRRLLTGP